MGCSESNEDHHAGALVARDRGRRRLRADDGRVSHPTGKAAGAVCGGGPTDVVARILADFLTARWNGQSVVIENRPGAGTIVATAAVAKSPADGYTMLVATNSLLINPAIGQKLPYDTEKDFAAVSMVATQPVALVANKAFPAETIPQLVEVAKKSPEPLNFTSPGPRGVGHLAGEMLKQRAGINMTHINYNGSAPALTDVIAGRVPLMFDIWHSAKRYVDVRRSQADRRRRRAASRRCAERADDRRDLSGLRRHCVQRPCRPGGRARAGARQVVGRYSRGREFAGVRGQGPQSRHHPARATRRRSSMPGCARRSRAGRRSPRRPTSRRISKRDCRDRPASRHRLRRASDRAGYARRCCPISTTSGARPWWSAASTRSRPITYPPNAPLTARPEWRDQNGRAATSGIGARRAGLRPLAGGHRHLQLPLRRAACCSARTWRAAFTRALNDWVVKEWLDRDPRLRASIVVPMQNVEYAVDEIERCAKDRRFVQVLVLAMQEMPLGRRHCWPIYAAAERHGLPIGIHAGSSLPQSDDRRSAGRATTSRTMPATAQALSVAGGEPDLRGRVRQVSRSSRWCCSNPA